jgi:hypothetical protein
MLTHEAIILAADNIRRAGIAGSDTNHSNWRAGQTDKDVKVLEHNAQEPKDDTHVRGAGLCMQHPWSTRIVIVPPRID